MTRLTTKRAASTSFTDDAYTLFREFVRERTGIAYGTSRRKIFESRIASRIQALGMPTPEAYFRYLTFHPDRDNEFLKLISVLTNNETFFFREAATLETAMECLREQNKTAARILSAGSSSGEELATLTMMAKDRNFPLSDWTLQGVDIDTSMVDIAGKGIYRNKSFRNTDPEAMVKYFTPEGEHRRLKSNIHDHLKFRWANLVDPGTLRFPHKFDIILCRNVLIYFELETVQQVVETFHGMLADDGYLVVGISESLAHMPFLFDPIRKNGVILYQKSTTT